jgi:hypothetical protein
MTLGRRNHNEFTQSSSLRLSPVSISGIDRLPPCSGRCVRPFAALPCAAPSTGIRSSALSTFDHNRRRPQPTWFTTESIGNNNADAYAGRHKNIIETNVLELTWTKREARGVAHAISWASDPRGYRVLTPYQNLSHTSDTQFTHKKVAQLAAPRPITGSGSHERSVGGTSSATGSLPHGSA